MDLEQEEFFSAIISDNINKIKSLLEQNSKYVNIENKDGLLPLHVAAHHGKQNILLLLLKKGANIDSANNREWYTPLMFAAVSGNFECVDILVEHNANTKKTNKIGKTAAMLAQFVGNGRIARYIRHAYNSSDLICFTKTESRVRILPDLVKPLSKLLGISNFNPIWIALKINLMIETDTYDNIEQVMLNICEREHQKLEDNNQVLSLKSFYFQLIMQRMRKYSTEKWIKWLLKDEENYKGRPLWKNMENFIKTIPRVYCFPPTMVISVLQHEIESDQKTALECLNNCMGGQMSCSSHQCIVCDEMDTPPKLCKCRSVYYCGETCQKLHWFQHKKHCKQS